MPHAEDERHKQFIRSFAAHEPAIRAFIRRLVPLRADVDDITQDVAVVLWEKFPQFRDGGDFLAWALGVARYEVLAWRRDKARDRLVLAEDVVDLLAAESHQAEPHLERQRIALETCMKKIAAGHFQLLMQVYQPGNRIQELAAASGRTAAGVYQWLFRIRRSLLKCIQRELAREGP